MDINSNNMNIDKLERANILAKSLIPKINELLNISPKSTRSSIADAILGLLVCDKEFKTKYASYYCHIVYFKLIINLR